MWRPPSTKLRRQIMGPHLVTGPHVQTHQVAPAIERHHGESGNERGRHRSVIRPVRAGKDGGDLVPPPRRTGVGLQRDDPHRLAHNGHRDGEVVGNRDR